MLIGFVSDEFYAALADVQVEIRDPAGRRLVVRSSPSGAIEADISAGNYELIFAKAGFGSKRVRADLGQGVCQFRLLSDRMLGYAWPKWCHSGERVEFRMHCVESYKLGLWRNGLKKTQVRNVGWYDNHGPRAVMQILPDGFFVETGTRWDCGHGGQHQQSIVAPEQSGLYYFHAFAESGRHCSFPLVVAPEKPRERVAVLASTNTWNAYNPFGGRSNYILAAKMIDEPVVNSKSDLPRYRMADYAEWHTNDNEPLSFDRPEPRNQVPAGDEAGDNIEGRMECGLAPAEWRLLAWLERENIGHDLYADAQLHDGTLKLDDYQVLVLAVHPEYWSAEMYWKVKDWVFQRGGRLIYLGGNGLNCEVEFLADGAMRCLNKWLPGRESRMHSSIESEANLLGVVYSDPGAMTVAPYEVRDPEHWIFAGTGLARGSLFGTRILHQRYGHGASGHETDKISPNSPPGLHPLAKGTNPDDGGAEIVAFQTTSGGQVFSAGSITYSTGLLCDWPVSRITRNVFQRFLR